METDELLKVKEMLNQVIDAGLKSQNDLEDWKKSKSEQIELKGFETPKELLNVLVKNDTFHALLFYGEGGIGKTLLTISKIKETFNPLDWEYSNGYTTPLALYEFLFKTKDKKIVILDDVEGVFNNPLSLSILKGAIWDTDGKRIVHYNSKSEKAEMPNMFMCNAKLIILCNKLPKQNDVSIRALISRTMAFELNFDYETKFVLCKKLIDASSITIQQKELALKILKENTSKATMDFNFRTIKKLMAFVQHSNTPETIFKDTIKTDEDKEVYLNGLSLPTINLQISNFIEKTGKSRRTFFNIKKELSAKVQSKTDVALALSCSQPQSG